ncbi:MAG: hypothetical protein AAB945_00985 [Patescibacteria group bacterium]
MDEVHNFLDVGRPYITEKAPGDSISIIELNIPPRALDFTTHNKERK